MTGERKDAVPTWGSFSDMDVHAYSDSRRIKWADRATLLRSFYAVR